LGEWLLDDVLKVPSGQVVTMDMLDALGIDSVEIRKIDAENFEIDFKETGTFEDFRQHYEEN
ncbi:MAG TPA: restriction endonuclease, partial [bacterium]|nr:restriction endonuclease [bacterium]